MATTEHNVEAGEEQPGQGRYHGQHGHEMARPEVWALRSAEPRRAASTAARSSPRCGAGSRNSE